MCDVGDSQQAASAGACARFVLLLHAACSFAEKEAQTPGKHVSPEWEGLFDAMRIKVTRENAEFLAAGLVKKLFQVMLFYNVR